MTPHYVKCGCGCTDRREEAWQEWALDFEANNLDQEEPVDA